jgi:hypothetical protein
MLAGTEVVAHFNADADARGYAEALHQVVETSGRKNLSLISNSTCAGLTCPSRHIRFR